MAVDDALNSGQSYSSAFKLFRPMQTLKDAEQLVYVLHVKASAVVPHEHLDLTFISVHTADWPAAGSADTEWPAAGSADTELGVLLEPEVGHGATEVYARIQARGGRADQGAGGKCRAGLARSGCARDSAAQLGEGVCG